MVYSGDDIVFLGGQFDDEEEDDREEDIKLVFFKKFYICNVVNGEDIGEDKNGFYEKFNVMEDGFEDGEIDDFDEDGDENFDECWIIWKCFVVVLDVFVRDFCGLVFEVIFLYFFQNFKYEDWLYCEVVVLVFGVVVEGCMDVVIFYFFEFVFYLFSFFND